MILTGSKINFIRYKTKLEIQVIILPLSKFKFRYVKKYNISYFSSGISGRAIKHNVKIGSISGLTPKAFTAAYISLLENPVQIILWLSWTIGGCPKSNECSAHWALRQVVPEPVEMTATLNVVVSINSTTVMQTYWTAPFYFTHRKRNNRIFFCLRYQHAPLWKFYLLFQPAPAKTLRSSHQPYSLRRRTVHCIANVRRISKSLPVWRIARRLIVSSTSQWMIIVFSL